MRVEYGKKLLQQLQTLVLEDKMKQEQIDKVFNFAQHVKINGLSNLVGRNKDSQNVPTDDPDFIKKVQKAREKKWWHYHIGIHEYLDGGCHGDMTSLYVLHYANHSPHYIRIGKLDYHPPFLLPYDTWLQLR